MNHANAQLEDALRQISNDLPGELIQLQLICDSETFAAKRCFARFKTEAGPIRIEIPLEPGFCARRWITQHTTALTRH